MLLLQMEIKSFKKALVSLQKTPEQPAKEETRAHPVLMKGKDPRSCEFCHTKGDGLAGDIGRLLPMARDKWAHLNCARVVLTFLHFPPPPKRFFLELTHFFKCSGLKV